MKDKTKDALDAIRVGVAAQALATCLLVPLAVPFLVLPGFLAWPMALALLLVEAYFLGAFLRAEELDPLPADEYEDADDISIDMPWGASRVG